jgi:hypothetical protein
MTAWDPACVGYPLFRGRTPANAVNMASPYIASGAGTVGSTAHPGLVPPTVPPAPGGGSASACVTEHNPFDILLLPSETSPGMFDIKCVPGLINGMMPNNNMVAISGGPYDPTTTRYVKLKATAVGSSINTATLAMEATTTAAIGSAEQAPPASFEFLLGIVWNGTLYQVSAGHINALSTLVLQTSVSTPTPGLSPYINWYTWAFSVYYLRQFPCV